MTIEEYFGDWSTVVDLREADRIMKKLSVSSWKVCPEIKNVFKAFRLCPFRKLKVIVIGQDPYPTLVNGIPTATGIAFANATGTVEKSLSPSLEKLREAVIDYTKPHGSINFEPDLENWERQGVLLLNAALSCQAGKPSSHLLLWRPFMKSLLNSLSMNVPGLIYILLGEAAQSFKGAINQRSNYIFWDRHPAWYVREKKRMPSKMWREVDALVKRLWNETIEWYKEIH